MSTRSTVSPALRLLRSDSNCTYPFPVQFLLHLGSVSIVIKQSCHCCKTLSRCEALISMTKCYHMLRSPMRYISRNRSLPRKRAVSIALCIHRIPKHYSLSLDGACIKEEGPQIRGFRCVPLAALPRRAQGRTGDDGQLSFHSTSPAPLL